MFMMAARHGLSADDADRIRMRALAKWLILGSDDAAGGLPEGAITELREDDGRLYVVVTSAAGEALARYRVVHRGERWCLYRAPLYPLPPLPDSADSVHPLPRS